MGTLEKEKDSPQPMARSQGKTGVGSLLRAKWRTGTKNILVHGVGIKEGERKVGTRKKDDTERHKLLGAQKH